MPDYEAKFNQKIKDIHDRNSELVEEIKRSTQERNFFLIIRPTNVSGIGDPSCLLIVTESKVVLSEPIDAKHANDDEALRRARADVAKRLGVPESNIGY